MFRPVNQRVPILFAIALINLSLFFWVSSSRSPMYSSGFEQKVESAELFNESIDIIRENQTLREGIKTFSDWPTIPQLYIKKEFVGGCDIVKEMYESGELQKVFDDKGINYKKN